MRDFSRLDSFLDTIEVSVYPEPPVEPHISITSKVIGDLVEMGWVYPGAAVLDVGCGQGLALRRFRGLGAQVLGTALGDEDLDVCRELGFWVVKADQSFMIPPLGVTFDLIWARHVLEHSFAPFFTLTELWCLTKPGGHLYVEVPAPDTVREHEGNVNHYSVFGQTAWRRLITRARFVIEKEVAIKTPVGDDEQDVYYSFYLTR